MSKRSSAHGPRRRSRRGRIGRIVGVSLMTSSLAVGAAVGVLSPAAAQEEPEPVELELQRSGYWNYPVGSAVPDTLTSEFPPGAMCVVEPQLCPEDLDPVFGPVGDGLGELETMPTLPAGTVAEGSVPVGTLGGEPRYVSAYDVVMPEVPSGHELDDFVVLLEETQPTFSFSSPAFRQAVLAIFASIAAGEPVQEQFEKFVETLASNPVDQPLLGVEACPIVGDWEEGRAQNAQASLPEVDCIFGTNGQRQDDGVWRFDLTFTAQAWADGTLENKGFLLRPSSAPNLAFGDPDTSSNAQVSFSLEPVRGIVVSSPATQPPTLDQGPSTGGGVSQPPSSSGGFSGGGGSAPSSSVDAFSPPASPSTSTPAPDVAGDQPVAGGDVVAQPPVTAGAVGEAGTPWWVWLLVPVFAIGMWMTAQSLTAETMLTAEREGAMSRLIAQRRAAVAGTAGDTPAIV